MIPNLLCLLYSTLLYSTLLYSTLLYRKPAEVLQREQQAKQERLTAPDEPEKKAGPEGDVDCKQQ